MRLGGGGCDRMDGYGDRLVLFLLDRSAIFIRICPSRTIVSSSSHTCVTLMNGPTPHGFSLPQLLGKDTQKK